MIWKESGLNKTSFPAQEVALRDGGRRQTSTRISGLHAEVWFWDISYTGALHAGPRCLVSGSSVQISNWWPSSSHYHDILPGRWRKSHHVRLFPHSCLFTVHDHRLASSETTSVMVYLNTGSRMPHDNLNLVEKRQRCSCHWACAPQRKWAWNPTFTSS
jgi:hypothetical protein